MHVASCFCINLTVLNLCITVPGDAPANASGYALDSTSIYLSWDPPPPEYHHGPITGYRIAVTEVETGVSTLHATNDTEIVIDNLHPYYIYNCTIVAVTIDEGPHKAIVLVQTNEAGECISNIYLK